MPNPKTCHTVVQFSLSASCGVTLGAQFQSHAFSVTKYFTSGDQRAILPSAVPQKQTASRPKLWAIDGPALGIQVGALLLRDRGVGVPNTTLEIPMPNHRKSLSRPRKHAYQQQHGHCFYCGTPMWLDDHQAFARRHTLSPKQALLLKCTGEHLVAHSEGGSAARSNIVAACWLCNQRRHKAKDPKTPGRYRKFVRSRINKGKWLPFQLQAEVGQS